MRTVWKGGEGARRNWTHVVRVWVRGPEKLCFVATSFLFYLTNRKQYIKTENATQRINLKNSKIIRIWSTCNLDSNLVTLFISCSRICIYNACTLLISPQLTTPHFSACHLTGYIPRFSKLSKRNCECIGCIAFLTSSVISSREALKYG